MGFLVKPFVTAAKIFTGLTLAVIGVVVTAIPGGQFIGPILVSIGTGIVLSTVSGLFKKKPITGNTLTDQRLNKSVNPEAFRKIIFGETAMALDVRYWEDYGTNDVNFDEVIVVAGHEIESFGKFSLEEQEHTFDGSGNSNILGNAFRRFTRTVGVTGTTLSAGAGIKWTNTSSLTGMAFMVLKYVRSQEKWPQGFPNKMTQVGKGAFVYDPRLDSTVPGGTGTHRIDDQLTWQYNDGTTDIGRNPALQMLWYLVGWRILGVLVCGMGVKTNAINLVEFQQAANDAEMQGFESDCSQSTGDDHEINIGIIEATCGGRLLDTGGIYTFKIAIDDTADIAVAFDDNDVMGPFQWIPAKKIVDQIDIFSGVYVEPLDLYRLKPFPEVKDVSLIPPGGSPRRANNRFVAVQDPIQAQKLSRILLNQTRFQGIFKATFSFKAMLAKNWDIVTLTLAAQGWTNELFRTIQYDITTDGTIILTLEQTDPSIYVAGATSMPTRDTGNAGNPRAKISLLGLAAAPIVVSGEGQAAEDGLRITFTAPNGMVQNTVIQYRIVGDTQWIAAGTLNTIENSLDLVGLSPNTAFDIRAKHISIVGVVGDFFTTVGTTDNGTILDLDNVGGVNFDDDTPGFFDNDTNLTFDRAGNPDSDATNNIICEQPDEPPVASDGDMWLDTSGIRTISRKFINGAFRVSATDGAVLGINILDVTGTPQGDAELKNIQQEWDDVKDANVTRPQDNATLGATEGSDFFKAGGFTLYTTGEFENVEQEWDEVQNAGGNRPANNATIGAVRGTNFFKSGGVSLYTIAEFENLAQEWDQVQDAGGTRPVDNATLGATWDTDLLLRPAELTDGRIAVGLDSVGDLGRNLNNRIKYDQGDGTFRGIMAGLEFGSAIDADVITFAQAYANVPIIQFIPGGTTTNAGLTGDVATSYQAINQSVTGFTASLLLKELAGTPFTNTDTGAVSGATFDLEMEKGNTTPNNAWNNEYIFQFDVTVQNVPNTDPGIPFDFLAGSCVIALYMKKTASADPFIKFGTLTVGGLSGISPQTARLNNTKTIVVSGVTDFSGVQFAVDLDSSVEPGSNLTSFDSVKYDTATAPNEADAVPVGATAIPWRSFI